MAPSPATTGVATPSPSLARTSVPTRSSPSYPQWSIGGESRRVDGTLTRVTRGSNAITELGQSFSAGSVYSLSTHHNRGGNRRVLVRATLTYLGHNAYAPESLNAVVSALQYWYQRHSNRQYLARQTQRRLAAITLQCWKRHIWLNCWFALQAQQHQKRLRLRMLNPKILRHPFRDRGLLVPRRKRAQRHNGPRRRVG